MRRADLLAASGAALLLGLQVVAGGVRPWAGRAEWDRVGARAGEVAALEEERSLERETARLLESALGPARDSLPSDAEPPFAWRERLGSLPTHYEWGRVGPGSYRLEASGRFEDVLDLIGLVDSDPGPYVVRSFDLAPDRGRVRMVLRLGTAGGGR